MANQPNKSVQNTNKFTKFLEIVNSTFVTPFMHGALFALGQIVISLAWKQIRAKN